MSGLCQGTGIIAYSKTDLLPHGYILREIVREYPPGESPSDAELANPKVGQFFKQIPNPDYMIESTDDPFLWEETRLQLPAIAFTVNFQFRTRVTSDNLSVEKTTGGSGGLSYLGGGVMGSWGAALLNTLFTGGMTDTKSKLIWQAISSQTRYDIPIVLTEESKNTGIIQSPGWISALMGVFKEPLDLSDETKLLIGTSDREWWNSKGIQNDVDGDGVWRGAAIEGTNGSLPIFQPTKDKTSEEIFDEKNLVVEVVRDDRAIAFLSENGGIADQQYGYSHRIDSYNLVIFDKIKINTDGMKVGDTVYLTMNIAKDRYFREKMFHDGTLAELGTADGAPLGRSGGAKTVFNISSKWQVHHSHIVKTRVKSGDGIPLSDDVLDEDFIDKVKPTINDVLTTDPPNGFEDLESWRLSGSIGTIPRYMFLGDKTGIYRLTLSGTINSPIVNSAELMIGIGDIKDYDWYAKFLSDNNFEDFSVAFSGVDGSHVTGLLFDLSLQNNILLDKEKAGYQRELAEAIMLAGSDPGIGISNLDLVIAGRDDAQIQNSLQNFDLSSANFKTTGATSKFPGAWIVNTCVGDDTFGSYYDPNDPLNKFSVFVPLPGGDLVTDWQYGTAVYNMSLDRRTRIYTELFQPGGAVDKRYSLIYPTTVPIPDSSLSLDFTSNARKCFVFFQNFDKNAISYYMFRDGEEGKALHAMSLFPEGNHIRPDYNHDDFKFLGYNIAAGDSPGYSEGQIISNEIAYICGNEIPPAGFTEPLTREDIYTDGTWIDEDTKFESTTYTIESDANNLYRDIILSYDVKDNFELKQNIAGGTDVFKGTTRIGDNFMSIEFVNSNQVIDNISLPVHKGISKISLDGRFYGSSQIKLHGDLIDKVTWKNISTTFTDSTKISPFWIKSGQTATAIDGRDYIHVFYHDELSGNISCIMSDNLGSYWYNFRDIIRLVKGETADQPYTITDKNTDTIHLFYRLNGQYLMVKSIKTDWFVCKDQFEQYTPPGDFDETSDDLVGIKQYSEGGQSLRREGSRFVHGNSDNEFVKRQQAISQERLLDIAAGKKSSYRFIVDKGLDSRTAHNMTSDYDGLSCVYLDNRGNYRVFLTSSEGRMSIKSSSDLSEWGHDIKDMWVHRDFFTDEPDKDDMTIENPQVVFDKSSNIVYWLYFHRDGLYSRRLPGDAFYPSDEFLEYSVDKDRVKGTNDDGSFSASSNFRTEFEVNEETPAYPVFLIGELPGDLSKAARDDDDNLDVIIPYETFNDAGQVIFDKKFAVNTGTKPVGYAMRNGMIRLFYKTEQGLNYGLSINGDWIYLDTQLRYVT
jgi:hypothetical protein